MRLPRWTLQWAAKFLVDRSKEWGGIIHDYANGRWVILHKWNDQKGEDEGLDLIFNMFDRGGSDIYVTCIKVGERHGYFIVSDYNQTWWRRSFWDGIYSPSEAFKDAAVKARQIADQMGYRKPEDTEGVQS